MTINLLSYLIAPKVTSSKPFLENYDPNNLVQRDDDAISTGFISESFVSPPVDLQIQFPFPVSLESILLGSKHRGHQSICFEIFSSIADKDCKMKIFDSIGKAYSCEATVFRFTNKKFNEKLYLMSEFLRDSAQKDVAPFHDCAMDFDLTHHNDRFLHEIMHLTVRIKKTASKSLCAIGFLQLLGLPSRKNPSNIFHELVTALQKNQKNKEIVPMSSSTKDKSCCANNEDIPVEFVDPITQEIMTFPIVLPSGHTIDQSTLERHNAAQVQWSQYPTNPFTGEELTGQNKSWPNTKLKIRIDSFLLEKPDIVVNGRAVGGSNPMSKLLTTMPGSSNINVLGSKPKASIYPADLYSRITTFTSPPSRCIPSAATHEEDLHLSLDSALQAALMRNQPQLERIVDQKICRWCNALNGPTMYQLLCSHCICRQCLLVTNESRRDVLTCSICGTDTTRDQIVRVHDFSS